MLSLAAYLHRIDPFAIRFPDGFPMDGIRWYGLSYLLGFLLAYLIIRRIATVGRTTLKPASVSDMVVTLAIGIVVGGRLGYALFYKPELFVRFSPTFPWWDLLALNQGGMASHGGIIGAIVASYYYAWRHQHRWTHLLDLFGFTAALGVFFGRIANFINGELYGRPTTPDFPLAVKFPQELDELARRSPELVRPVIARADVIGALRPYDEVGIGPIHALQDLVQRGNADVIALVEPILTPRHPSQLYQALLEGLLVFIVLAILWAKPRKPGVVAGAAALSYGIARIIGELFREPDAHIGFDFLGVTRGQWLSIGPIVLGIALLLTMSRRNTDPMGGWMRNNA